MKNEMTPSPAAQAVLDAFLAEWPDEALEQDRRCLAAALRAAANEIAPIENEIIDNCWYEKANPIREQLFTIADELEA